MRFGHIDGFFPITKSFDIRNIVSRFAQYRAIFLRYVSYFSLTPSKFGRTETSPSAPSRTTARTTRFPTDAEICRITHVQHPTYITRTMRVYQNPSAIVTDGGVGFYITRANFISHLPSYSAPFHMNKPMAMSVRARNRFRRSNTTSSYSTCVCGFFVDVAHFLISPRT